MHAVVHVANGQVLPKHWRVERTVAWLNRCLRLARDWERMNRFVACHVFS